MRFMFISSLRVAGRSRAILHRSGGVSCIQNVRPSRKSARWLTTTSALSSLNNGLTNCRSNQHTFRVRSLTSQNDTAPSIEASAKPLIKESKICKSSRMLLLEWDDGAVSRYPFVWLRDNCRCNICWHHDAQGRLSFMENLNVNIEPNSVSVSEDGAKIDILWPDNHLSQFEAGLLKDVTFKDEPQGKNIRMWGSELVGQIPTFQFDEIMTDDVKLLNLLEDLRDIGLTLTKGVPAETGHLAKFVDRISYLKVTYYGSVHTLKSKTSPNNLAFAGLQLGFHTDLNHYHYKPNITVFHCIQQSTTGGESMFADGFKTALQLKEEDPDAFKTLCDTYCDYIHKGRRGTVDYCSKCARPTFSFDRYGNIDGVHFDQTSRDIRLRIPVERVYPYYKAIKDYYDLINRPENRVNFRMQPGDIIMLENTRILHGRNAFTVTEGAERHLESVFMDWDSVYSKIRCLREKLGMSFHDY